jgi:hypothetical protein
VARDASTVSWRPVSDDVVVWQPPGVVPISTEESSYVALLSGPSLFHSVSWTLRSGDVTESCCGNVVEITGLTNSLFSDGLRWMN